MVTLISPKLQTRDCLISAGQGRPRAINIKDCELKPPSLDDFPEPHSKGALFMAYVEICSLLGDLTECCSRKYMSPRQRTYIKNALYRWIRDLPEHLSLRRKSGKTKVSSYTSSDLTNYDFEARQLHIPYFITLILLYRPPSPGCAPSAVALLASSFVAGIFEDFLARDEIRYLGPIFTFYLLAIGVAQLSSYRYPRLWETAEEDLATTKVAQRELANRWPSAIGSIKALQGITDAVTKQARTETYPSIIKLSPNQRAFFSELSSALCRAWEPLLSQTAGYQQGKSLEAYERPRADAAEAMTMGTLPNPNVSSATSTFGSYMPTATVLDSTTNRFLDATAGAEVSMLSNQYEGIGTWLLGDYGTNFTC